MNTLHVGKRYFAVMDGYRDGHWTVYSGTAAMKTRVVESQCFEGLDEADAIRLVEMFDRLTEPAAGTDSFLILENEALDRERSQALGKLNALRTAVKDFLELSKQQSSISTYSDAIRHLREVYDAN